MMFRMAVVDTDSIGHAQSKRDMSLLQIAREWNCHVDDSGSITCDIFALEIAFEIVRNSYSSSLVLIKEDGSLFRGPHVLEEFKKQLTV